jgi:Xaa-Pro aminopeptidase
VSTRQVGAAKLRPDSNEPFAIRWARTGVAVAGLGAGALLATDPATVRWLTGRQIEIGWGPLYPVSAGTVVLVGPDGHVSVLCPDGEASLGPPVTGLTVYTYATITAGPLRPFANLRELIAGAARAADVPAGKPWAIEAHAHAAALLPSGDWLDATETLRALRTVKDQTEIRRIEAAALVASAGQRAFREHAEPGISEIELFSIVHAAMEREARERVPVLLDLMSGPRMVTVGTVPVDRQIEVDELALCDLGARVDGYWSDSCTTICVGRPTAEMRRLHDACRRALDQGIVLARPGAVTGAIDDRLRGTMRDAGYEYPHHSGHGVGTVSHEEPRLVPGATAVLEEGMVIALEPAGFGNGIGCRLEHLMEVTPNGGRVLTDYDLRLDR